MTTPPKPKTLSNESLIEGMKALASWAERVAQEAAAHDAWRFSFADDLEAATRRLRGMDADTLRRISYAARDLHIMSATELKKREDGS